MMTGTMPSVATIGPTAGREPSGVKQTKASIARSMANWVKVTVFLLSGVFMPNLHETEYGILGATVAAASRHGEGSDVVIRDHLTEWSNVHCSRFLAARFEPAHAVPVAFWNVDVCGVTTR
jgi:predicted anti-sigma-YlaC factor YlaD